MTKIQITKTIKNVMPGAGTPRHENPLPAPRLLPRFKRDLVGDLKSPFNKGRFRGI
jgi:hypothetical protein